MFGLFALILAETMMEQEEKTRDFFLKILWVALFTPGLKLPRGRKSTPSQRRQALFVIVRI